MAHLRDKRAVPDKRRMKMDKNIDILVNYLLDKFRDAGHPECPYCGEDCTDGPLQSPPHDEGCIFLEMLNL